MKRLTTCLLLTLALSSLPGAGAVGQTFIGTVSSLDRDAALMVFYSDDPKPPCKPKCDISLASLAPSAWASLREGDRITVTIVQSGNQLLARSLSLRPGGGPGPIEKVQEVSGRLLSVDHALRTMVVQSGSRKLTISYVELPAVQVGDAVRVRYVERGGKFEARAVEKTGAAPRP